MSYSLPKSHGINNNISPGKLNKSLLQSNERICLLAISKLIEGRLNLFGEPILDLVSGDVGLRSQILSHDCVTFGKSFIFCERQHSHLQY